MARAWRLYVVDMRLYFFRLYYTELARKGIKRAGNNVISRSYSKRRKYPGRVQSLRGHSRNTYRGDRLKTGRDSDAEEIQARGERAARATI